MIRHHRAAGSRPAVPLTERFALLYGAGRTCVPRLQELRTIAARGNSRVEPLFENFREMFLYAHLEPMYRNRAWVIVDGDQDDILLVDRLKAEFSGWEANHFQYWPKDAFELYYPSKFSEAVERTLSIEDRRLRREAKKKLLLDVINWIEEDENRGSAAFKESAAEVINVLQDIERQMTDT